MKKSILFLVFACSIYSYGATAMKTEQAGATPIILKLEYQYKESR